MLKNHEKMDQKLKQVARTFSIEDSSNAFKGEMNVNDLALLYSHYRSIPIIIASRLSNKSEFIKWIGPILLCEEWKYCKHVKQEVITEFLDLDIEEVTLSSYAEFTKSTAVYSTKSNDAITYLTLGLFSEGGEVANIIKKILRGDYSETIISKDKGIEKINLPDEVGALLISEIGDLLWYISELCRNLNYDIEDILRSNIQKLTVRKRCDEILSDIRNSNEIPVAPETVTRSLPNKGEIDEVNKDTIPF